MIIIVVNQRGHEHLLAAQPVAEVAEHQRSDGAGHEPYAERRERCEGAQDGVDVREEQLAEDQRRRDPVEVEVVPLEHRAREARRHHLGHRLVGRSVRHRYLPLLFD